MFKPPTCPENRVQYTRLVGKRLMYRGLIAG